MLCVSVALGNENIWEIFAHAPWMGRLQKSLIWSRLKWKVSLASLQNFTVIPFMFFIWAFSSFKLWNPLLWIDPQCIVCPLIILSCSCCSCPHNLLILALVIQFALLVILLSGFGHKWRRPLSSSPFLCVLVFVIPLLCPCHNYLSVSCCFCPNPCFMSL